MVHLGLGPLYTIADEIEGVTMISIDAVRPLQEFKPKHKFFVGIDSDGCAFDSMGIKQRECFCPWMIGCFGLQPIAEAARQCKEFADLFSKTRGANRHTTIVRILTELLPKHPIVVERGFKVPQFRHYCEWVNNPQSFLSDAGLKRAIEEAKSEEAKKELSIALEWSKRVNQAVADIVRDIPPFPYVYESLEKVSKVADTIVVSATPGEALEREWQEHRIAQYASIIAGQEMGSKKEHLLFAANGKYAPHHILMIGDALGDMSAARANNVLFYPINPGHEVASWRRFFEEAFDKFINGRYAGEYEAKLIAEFDAYLPGNPPWAGGAR
jgi:phosphoglycolate phosphatase-like HAD superfamily hydrolase